MGFFYRSKPFDEEEKTYRGYRKRMFREWRERREWRECLENGEKGECLNQQSKGKAIRNFQGQFAILNIWGQGRAIRTWIGSTKKPSGVKSSLLLMWKLLAGVIAEEMYDYLEQEKLLPEERTWCCLLIDKTVLKDCKKRRTNLSMI